MIWQLLRGLRGGLSDEAMVSMLVNVAATAAVLIFCLPVHEYAHGWTAKKLGDNTAWLNGRLTLNPSKHLDLLGTLMIIFVGFGYAKPVPVNPRNFKNHKKGMAITAAAGPLSNLILAVIICIIYNILYLLPLEGDFLGLLVMFFGQLFFINVALMVFNLIPVPPLDGSRILDLFLPNKASWFIAEHQHIFRWAVYALLIFSSPINWLATNVALGIDWLVGLPFRLIS